MGMVRCHGRENFGKSIFLAKLALGPVTRVVERFCWAIGAFFVIPCAVADREGLTVVTVSGSGTEVLAIATAEASAQLV